MTVDLPWWLVWGSGGVLLIVVLLVVGWAHPATTWMVRRITGGLWGLLAALAALAALILIAAFAWRRRPDPDEPDEDEGPILDLRAKMQRAETRAALEASRRRAAEAVAAPDPAEGWAEIDAEEAALDEALLRNREPGAFNGRGRS